MTDNLQAYPDQWPHECLDPFPGYLPDSSNETGPYFGNPALGSAFETNAEAGCVFDPQPAASDHHLFDLSPSLRLSPPSQVDFDQRNVSGSHSQCPSLGLSESPNALTALARLNEDLARQASHLDSHIWGPVNGGQHCLDKVQKTEGNPLAEMLQSTSEFVTILENLVPLMEPPIKSVDRALEHPPSASQLGTSSSNGEKREILPPSTLSPGHRTSTDPKPLGTPVLLMLLSSYIQLLQLYDAIFSRVHDSLSGVEDIRALFQELPEFRLAGLTSMKGPLYGKIILQIIEHHFDQLERLLGLPVEFGLSEQGSHSQGLFSTTDLSHLLDVTMTQVTGSPGTSGSLTLKSFRRHLRGLQAMLPE